MPRRVRVRGDDVTFIAGNDTVRRRRLKVPGMRANTAGAGVRVSQRIRRWPEARCGPMAGVAGHRNQVDNTIDV